MAGATLDPDSSAVVVALAGMAALAVPMGIGRFALTPVLPMVQSDRALSVVDGAWLASANYAGTLAGAVCAALMRIAGLTGALLTAGGLWMASAVALWPRPRHA